MAARLRANDAEAREVLLQSGRVPLAEPMRAAAAMVLPAYCVSERDGAPVPFVLLPLLRVQQASEQLAAAEVWEPSHSQRCWSLQLAVVRVHQQ